MTDRSKPFHRRLLIEVREVREYGYLHEDVIDVIRLQNDKRPAFAFESSLIGEMFEQDGYGGDWQQKQTKNAFIRFRKYDEFDPQQQLDDQARPICGWVDGENQTEIQLCFVVPTAFAGLLLEHIQRSRPGGCSLTLTLDFRASFRTGERTGEYIIGIYYNHPSIL